MISKIKKMMKIEEANIRFVRRRFVGRKEDLRRGDLKRKI